MFFFEIQAFEWTAYFQFFLINLSSLVDLRIQFHLDVSISKSRGVLFEDLETVEFEPRYTVSYTDKLH